MSPEHLVPVRELADRVVTLRQYRQMSQQQLADKSGISQKQISRLERGELTSPSLADVIAVANALDVPLEKLATASSRDFITWVAGQTAASLPAFPDPPGEDVLAQARERRLLEICGDELLSDMREWVKHGFNVIVHPSTQAAVATADELVELVSDLEKVSRTEVPVGTEELVRRLRDSYRRWLSPSRALTGGSITDEQFVELQATSAPWADGVWAVWKGHVFPATAPGVVRRLMLVINAAAQGRPNPRLEGVPNVDVVIVVQDHGISDVMQVLRGADDNPVTLSLHAASDTSPLERVSSWVQRQSSAAEFASAAAPIVIDDPLNPPPGYLALGEMYSGSSDPKVVGMPVAGLKSHAYLCGSTGTGKSTLMEWIAYGLAKNGESVMLLDPHGSLADDVLESVLAFAPERADDVVLLDFSDVENPISFNPLAIDSIVDLESTVNSVKEMIMKTLNLSFDSAPRAVNYVEQAVWALCETNIALARSGHRHLALTLLQVPTFFTDGDFRQQVMQFVTNMSIRETYDPNGPFEQLGSRKQLDHVMPVLRMFSSLAAKDRFSNVFGQSVSRVDFAKLAREDKLVIIKLPAAVAGDHAVARVVVATITPMLIGSLHKWKDDPETRVFYLVDEFQNYATESFKELLATTRKYGLHAIVANQVPQDLPADVLRGVQSNTQNKFVNRLDAQASKVIGDFIAGGQPYPTTDDIAALPNHWTICNHMLEDGRSSGPYVFRGLPAALDAGDDHPQIAGKVQAGRENLERLLPVAVRNSQVGYTVPRAVAAEHREKHVRQVRQVLAQMIAERQRAGGYDAPPNAALNDYWERRS